MPDYSNRDAVYNDICGARRRHLLDDPDATSSAPGRPAPTGRTPTAGPTEFQDAIGTSFAAPQVSAAAALLLGEDPKLTPDQVSWLLERSAVDATAATGCVECPARPRRLHGLGNGSTSTLR